MNNYTHSVSQIYCFILVAEQSNFTKAANILKVSNTAVSKNIKNLEKRIGKQLLERTNRSVKLTSFGSMFYSHCKKLEKNLNEIENFIDSRRSEPQGSLTVLIADYVDFTGSKFMRNLNKFIIKYPKINLDIQYTEEDIENHYEEVDIMIGFKKFPALTSAFKEKLLRRIEGKFYASPKYIKEYGLPKNKEDLQNHKFISHSNRRPMRKVYLQSGEYITIPEPALKINRMHKISKACADGLGILFMSTLEASSYVQKGQLVEILPKVKCEKIHLYMFYKDYEYELSTIRAFIDFFLEDIK